MLYPIPFYNEFGDTIFSNSSDYEEAFNTGKTQVNNNFLLSLTTIFAFVMDLMMYNVQSCLSQVHWRYSLPTTPLLDPSQIQGTFIIIFLMAGHIVHSNR